jgi:hypothetical protein
MIKPPTKATVKKYGLTIEEWFEMLEIQGGVCAICKKEPSTGRICVDHEHVALWKKKSPAERKIYARGLLCWYCNSRLVGKGVTLEKARNIVKYLENYQNKRLAYEAKSMPASVLTKKE